MAKVKLGVVGCGVIGKRHIDVASRLPDVELVAVCDLRLDEARRVAGKHGVKKVYGAAQELLNDGDVEAVVLAFPTAGRAEWALKALQAGKHVLVEKPAAMNAGEVRAMAQAHADRVVACASMRFGGYESTKRAAEFVATGALGTLRLVRCRAIKPAGTPPSAPPPVWRLRTDLNGGGILVNWGVYDLDYLMRIAGWALRPTVVLAQAWPVPTMFSRYAAEGSNAEAHFTALIRCAGGEVISFERGEFVAAANDEAWQLIGDKGSLRLRMVPDQTQQMIFDQANPQAGVVSKVLWEGQEDFDRCHDWPIADFAQAILSKRPPATGLERMELMQRTIDAIYASARSGKAVVME